MNYITTSHGERITRSVFDSRIRKAKEYKLSLHFDEYGYYFCTTCKSNLCVPIDCAHIESVYDCIKNGYPEKAYDIDNIIIEGRICHQKRDKLNIQNGSCP